MIIQQSLCSAYSCEQRAYAGLRTKCTQTLCPIEENCPRECRILPLGLGPRFVITATLAQGSPYHHAYRPCSWHKSRSAASCTVGIMFGINASRCSQAQRPLTCRDTWHARSTRCVVYYRERFSDAILLAAQRTCIGVSSATA